ncbi:hypothetical protein VN12_12510 [Pirellula sp. SH-Sr6A]|uniref:hypothetical protein n=1 Tax=Pirellula sp. SH-Sr6A TaxID=1632865 RepID=UPI00078D7BE9|nr:hypothetical protein [Pirellula sp. SH-Sr6A]AMV32942.1 hypothetical protein VN12_12510 [Pirellula sp. SH-Sr6A]
MSWQFASLWRPRERRELRFEDTPLLVTTDLIEPDSGDCHPSQTDLLFWKQVVGYRYAQFSLRALDVGKDVFAFEFAPRWVPCFASRWDVLQDSLRPRVPDGDCVVYYAFPYRSPGFMAVQYLVCGRHTPYGTLRRCVQLVAWLAQVRRCQAVVCQAISDRLTERLMDRWGYVRHAKTLGPGHYIHRLPDPSPD